VSVCRDGRVRLYSPRQSPQPLQDGPAPQGTRAARVVWACADHYLVVSAMDKMSNRVLLIYDPAGLAPGPLHTFTLGVETSILIPHYDADSNTLFLTGRVRDYERL
jgi:coronin-7